MNLDDLMKKAKEIESKMKLAQSQLENLRIQGKAGGGLVEITFNGKHEAIETKIDDSLLSDKILLQDLITAAINGGAHEIESKTKKQFSDLTSGFDLPGV